MIDILLTALLLLALMGCVLYKAKVHTDVNQEFFNIQSTDALRGLWSIIVILVHIPKDYGNIIQDMAGSFAYVGVTFFFLISGYGLSLGILRSGTIQKGYWLKRLPKLLLPQLMVNIFSVLSFWLIFGDTITVSSLVWIARWLRWLLTCYLIFWLSHTLCTNHKWANAAIAICVTVFSITQYCLKQRGILTQSIWPTEVFGFLWGIVLAVHYAGLKNQGQHFWFRKTALICAAALLLGVLYLKFKGVIFWGDYLLKIVLGLAIIAFILFLNLKVSIGNKALDFLGKISYELYLSHTIVINIVERALKNASSGVFILTVFAASLIIATIIHYICAFVLGKISLQKKRL